MWVLRVPRDLLCSVLSLLEAFHNKTYDKGIRIAGTRKTSHMHVWWGCYKGCSLCLCNGQKHKTFDSKLVSIFKITPVFKI